MKLEVVLSGPAQLFMVVVLLVLAGCGGGDGVDRMSISGRVTVDGAPLPEGDITFAPQGAGLRVAFGEIADGKYSIPSGRGPVAGGKYKVKIQGWRDTGKKRPLSSFEKRAGQDAGTIREQYLPAKYNEQSTLLIEIQASQSELPPFELQSALD